MTLVDDLRQHIAAASRFNRAIDGHRRYRFNARTFTPLLGQGLGKEVLPQMADAAQCLGVAQAIVAVGRDITYRCALNV